MLAGPLANNPTQAVMLFIDFLETSHCNLRLHIRSLQSISETTITFIRNVKHTAVADDGPKFCI